MSLNYQKCLVRNNYASLKNMSSANILHEVVNVRSGTKISLDKTVIMFFNWGRFNSARSLWRVKADGTSEPLEATEFHGRSWWA